MILIECGFTDPPHVHEYPDDWKFGGADGLDPRADPRWTPTTYEYFDDRLETVWVTQTPLCDDEAIDQFTWVANLYRGATPVWCYAKRPDGTRQSLPVVYDKATDTAYDK